jgi:rsbT co-antagonist protein RsbR
MVSKSPPDPCAGAPGGAGPGGGEPVEALRAELEALRASHALLLAVVEHSPSVIFVKDAEGRYLFINRRFEQEMGASRDQVLGRTDHDVFPSEESAELRATDREALASERPVEVEEHVTTLAGPRVYLSIKFPLRDAGGAVTGVCGISTDLTDRRRAEEERAALQEQMIAAQRAALHELSTPLVPIAEGVIAMPLVGMIDGARGRQILESLLEGIGRLRAHTAILDITGVRVIDTHVANGLMGAARAARLLGARVVLTGISPNVAQTLVQLDVDLAGITTLSTLQSGIAYALGR